MKPRDAKTLAFQQFARVAKAAASPQRLEMLELLAQGERTVEGVAAMLGIPIANASHHLRALHAARLVDSRKQGTFVHYRLAGPDVLDLLRSVRGIAARRLAEMDDLVRDYFAERDALEPVGREELLERARSGDVLVLDVRPPEEYRAGHIEGAISIPVADLARRLAELPAGKEIVAYCRGPYCVMAFEAVARLRTQGRKARRLVDGFPEWRDSGLPIVVDAEAS